MSPMEELTDGLAAKDLLLSLGPKRTCTDLGFGQLESPLVEADIHQQAFASVWLPCHVHYRSSSSHKDRTDDPCWSVPEALHDAHDATHLLPGKGFVYEYRPGCESQRIFSM